MKSISFLKIYERLKRDNPDLSEDELDTLYSNEIKKKSKDIFIEKYGESLGTKKYNDYVSNPKINSLPWYINKYGEDDGRVKYSEFRNKCSLSNTLEGMINKYGKEEGERIYTEMKNKQSFGQTLNGYISKYGLEEGTRRYNEWIKKFSYSHTLEGYIDKYGELEGIKRYNNSSRLKSQSLSLDGFISKYGVEEGTILYKNWIRSSRMTLENCINKYGELEGTKRYESWVNNSRLTLENFISKYGLEEGTRRYNESNIKRFQSITKSSSGFSPCHSKISDELFKEISEKLIKDYNYSPEDIFYGENEISLKIDNIKTGNKILVRPDFYIKSKKLAVEFYGNYWHGNPETLSEDDDGESYSEIWNWDKIRIRSMYYSEFIDSVMIVWEKEYLDNKISVVNNIIKFLINYGQK